MDILEQVKMILSQEKAEIQNDESYRELLRSLFKAHDAYVAKQDWQGAYLALREILTAVIKEHQRQGNT